MAKPRIFISSTFYDLRQVRSDLDQFIESLGYEPIRNEEGDIPYGKEEELEEYCYKEIKMCDEIVDNAEKMKEQIRQVEEKEQEKVQKKKTRRYEL